MNSILYHGSKTTGIKTLQPSAHHAVDGESVVFATPDIRFALAMIHGTSNELAVGYFVHQESRQEEMYIKELVPNAFALLQAPGVIYTLNGAGFVFDSRLSHVECISKVEVFVISETPYADILTELKKYDITFVGYEAVSFDNTHTKKYTE